MLADAVSDECSADDRGYYVFNTVRNTTVVMHIEFFLAFSLAVNGCRSIVLLDDGALEHWDSIHDINHNGALTPYKANVIRRTFTKINAFIISRVYSHPLIEVIFLRDLLRNTDVGSTCTDEYRDIIERAAKSSCRRYSSNPSFWDDYENQEYYIKSLHNGVIFASVAQVLQDKFVIKKLITSHAIYSCWGVLFDILKKNDIPVLMYSELIYRGQYAVFSDQPVQNLSHGNEWAELVNSADAVLSPDARNQMTQFFEKRVNYDGYEHKYYFDRDSLSGQEIEKREDSVVFGMFPNIVWDGDIEQWHIIFEGIVDWVKQTIALVKDTDNILVVRCHPAEAKLLGHSPKLEDMLRASIPNLDAIGNVVILSSDIKLDVYGFIRDQIDIGLVYDGILGMEMAFMGKPVITAGSGRYAGSFFSEEPTSFAEYAELIQRPVPFIERANIEKDVRLERLLRFSWWYLHEKAYYIPILDKDDFFGVRIENVGEDTFSPANMEFQRTLGLIIGE